VPKRIEQKELERIIVAGHEKHPSYGYRKLTATLKLPDSEVWRVQSILSCIKTGKPLPGEGRNKKFILKPDGIEPDEAEPLAEEILRIKKSVLQKHENEAIRKRALAELLIEGLRDIVTPMPVPEIKPVPIKFNEEQGDEILTALLSDMHIGKDTRADETTGIGLYNIDVFKQRSEFYLESFKKILAKHYPTTPYKILNMFMLGDLMQGGDPTLPEGVILRRDLEAGRQMIEGVDAFGKIIGDLAVSLPWKINIFGVPGNHDRVGKKGARRPADSWSYIFYHFLKERLRDFKNVHFYIPESLFCFVGMYNKVFQLGHGDNTVSWMGVPFYGLERARGRYIQTLAEYGLPVNYYCVGHFHQIADIRGEIFANGSWDGPDEHALIKCQSASFPMQQLFSVHEKFGITWRNPIQLQPPWKRPKPIVYRGD